MADQSSDDGLCALCGIPNPEHRLQSHTFQPGRGLSWVVVCASGADHRDYGVGEVSRADTRERAEDAAWFMDQERESSPWECGPHTVRLSAPARMQSSNDSTGTTNDEQEERSRG